MKNVKAIKLYHRPIQLKQVQARLWLLRLTMAMNRGSMINQTKIDFDLFSRNDCHMYAMLLNLEMWAVSSTTAALQIWSYKMCSLILMILDFRPSPSSPPNTFSHFPNSPGTTVFGRRSTNWAFCANVIRSTVAVMINKNNRFVHSNSIDHRPSIHQSQFGFLSSGSFRKRNSPIRCKLDCKSIWWSPLLCNKDCKSRIKKTFIHNRKCVRKWWWWWWCSLWATCCS